MNQSARALVASVLVLLCAAGAAWPKPAAGPTVVRWVRPAAARDAALEAAIFDELYAGGVVTGSPERYVYNRVDLDGDGRAEALAYVYGTSSCGSAGCLLLVFRRAGRGYELVSRIEGAESPVVISHRRTNGWRDLIARVRWGELGGRTVRDYHAVLNFDGRTYPGQFPGSPRLGAGARVRGVGYFPGHLTRRTGFALRHPQGR